MTEKKTEALKALEEIHPGNMTPIAEEAWNKAITAIREALAEQPAQQQEPVAKPYAYEYGRDNGDGTYSVVIEKGDLVQTAPAVYNYVRPRNAHKDWPIKELFDSPPASKPLTDEQLETMWRDGPYEHGTLYDFKLAARATEAAHGIKGDA